MPKEESGKKVKRVKYNQQQFLRAEDFRDEQQYHISMRKEHNKDLHTPGVVSSDCFKVEAKKTGNPIVNPDPYADKSIIISKGNAYDRDGNTIILPEDTERDLSSICVNQDGSFIEELFVTVSYNENDDRPVNESGFQGFTRILEYPNIEYLTYDPTDPQHINNSENWSRLLLAKVKREKASGKIIEIEDRRVFAGVKITQIQDNDISDGAVTARALRSRTDDTKDHERAVTTDHIRNKAVTSDKLSSHATDNTKRAVGTDHIQDGAVTSGKLSSHATDNTKRAVGTDHIQDSAVTSGKLSSHATDSSKRAVDKDHIKDQAVELRHLRKRRITFQGEGYHSFINSGMTPVFPLTSDGYSLETGIFIVNIIVDRVLRDPVQYGGNVNLTDVTSLYTWNLIVNQTNRNFAIGINVINSKDLQSNNNPKIIVDYLY